MQQVIRQRKMHSNPTVDSSSTRAAALSVPIMMQASPQHYDYVMKLRVPLFFSILPRFLQKIICRFSILSFLAPSWERRFVILLGSYLYKFRNDSDPRAEPKGTPLEIDSLDINLLDVDHIREEEAAVAFSLLPPPGCSGGFMVSNLRKKHFFACATSQDAATWVNSLRQARDEAVKRRMGHAPMDSYPVEWTRYDRLGKILVDRKERIRRRMEESNLRELEMSNISEGANAPRAYFG